MFKSYKKVILGAVWAMTALATQFTQAYIVTSTGITVEATDVTNVTNASLVGVTVQFEILKFIGLFILISAWTWVVNTILSKASFGWGGWK